MGRPVAGVPEGTGPGSSGRYTQAVSLGTGHRAVMTDGDECNTNSKTKPENCAADGGTSAWSRDLYQTSLPPW